LDGKESIVGIKVRGGSLLDKRSLENIPNLDRIILTVPNEDLNIMRHTSLECTSSFLCLYLLFFQLFLIQGNSRGDNYILEISNFGF
jgi:hypothetical protein